MALLPFLLKTYTFSSFSLFLLSLSLLQQVITRMTSHPFHSSTITNQTSHVKGKYKLCKFIINFP